MISLRWFDCTFVERQGDFLMFPPLAVVWRPWSAPAFCRVKLSSIHFPTHQTITSTNSKKLLKKKFHYRLNRLVLLSVCFKYYDFNLSSHEIKSGTLFKFILYSLIIHSFIGVSSTTVSPPYGFESNVYPSSPLSIQACFGLWK